MGDPMLTYTLYGAPRTKKNSQQIRRTASGRPFVAPGKVFTEYERSCLAQIKTPYRPVSAAVNAKCLYYMPAAAAAASGGTGLAQRKGGKKMLERTLETQLRLAVERAGGMYLKWTCPGRRGVPDRMVLFPGGLLVFVELKRPGEKVKAQSLQDFWHDRLRQYDFIGRVISQPDEIDPFVDGCVRHSRALREQLKGVV